MFSDHNSKNLELTTKGIQGNPQIFVNYVNVLLNNAWVKKEIGNSENIVSTTKTKTHFKICGMQLKKYLEGNCNCKCIYDIRQKERSQINNLTCHFQKLAKGN